MELNVNEIIEKKIKELDENRIIEKAIEDKIEQVIKNAIDSAFSWDFSRAISDEIKKQIGNIAESVKLNSYNTLIADTVKNITENELKDDLAKKVQEKFHDIMLVDNKSIKFSDIVKKFKEVCLEEDETYEYEVSESSKDDGNFYYKTFDFVEPFNSYADKLSITFSRYRDDDWTIFKVVYDDETNYSTQGVSMLKRYDGFECLALKCLLNRLPIEIDWKTEDCEEELNCSNNDY